MPDQQQIFRGAVVAAPNDYTVGADVELILKQVNALLDGSGAAGDFLPAVVLISDSGHTIGRYVDRSNPVAAGGSAEVTWFSGVKGGSATPTASVFQSHTFLTRHAPGTLDPVQTIPSGAVTAIAWHGIQQSGGGAPGALVGLTSPATTLSFAEFGAVLVTLTVVWPAANYDRYLELTMANTADIGTVASPRYRVATSPAGDVMTLTAALDATSLAPATTVTANVFQASGAPQDISAEMTFWGTKPEVDLS